MGAFSIEQGPGSESTFSPPIEDLRERKAGDTPGARSKHAGWDPLKLPPTTPSGSGEAYVYQGH